MMVVTHMIKLSPESSVAASPHARARVFLSKAHISRHESPSGTLETSNPTDGAMMDLWELNGCNGSEKLEIHWESLQ